MMHTCDMITAVARLPPAGPHTEIMGQSFTTKVLRCTRIGHSTRNASPHRLASLARSLHELGHRPDFGFVHNFAQACRYMWTGFSPEVRRVVSPT